MEDFETKIEKAKELLNKLNKPDITLNESMKIYEEGLKSIKEATKMIEEAKIKYKEISSENSNFTE